MANYVGGISALIDIANHWIELQVTQAFVLFVGCTAYIFYGNLFRLSLEKEKQYEASSNRFVLIFIFGIIKFVLLMC